MLYCDIYLNYLWIVLHILWDIWYFFDDATTWHIGMYIIYMMKLYDDFIWQWDVMTQWWLRSTTSFYGRSMVKIAYGETMIHSTEAGWEILVREEWLRCHHDASLMLDILGSTPVWAQYIVFFEFKI